MQTEEMCNSSNASLTRQQRGEWGVGNMPMRAAKAHGCANGKTKFNIRLKQNK